MMMRDAHTHPLLKEVPGHLLQFEEKIFGMTLTQLLSDLGATVSIIALTASVPLVPRIVVGVLLMIGVLIFVHASVGGYPLFYWLYLLGRFNCLPTQTIFRPRGETGKKGEPGSIQECWMHLTTLDHGIAGVLTSRKSRDEPDANYWVVFEVSSLQQVRFLAEAEQVRIYGRFQSFLDGLGFPLKFISLVEAADAERDPALVAQRQVLSELAATPQLQKVQRESLRHQQGSLPHCTTTRHFVVVSAQPVNLHGSAPMELFVRHSFGFLIWSRQRDNLQFLLSRSKTNCVFAFLSSRRCSSNLMCMRRCSTMRRRFRRMRRVLPLVHIFPPLRLRCSWHGKWEPHPFWPTRRRFAGQKVSRAKQRRREAVASARNASRVFITPLSTRVRIHNFAWSRRWCAWLISLLHRRSRS